MSEGLTGQAIITISAAVVALTQLVKWLGISDKLGALAVLALSAVGVGLWVFSQNAYSQAAIFDIFAGWIAVATSAAGVFGFTRAASSAVISAKPPPSGGAGTSPTV